jgi:hypothetical protein
MCLVHFLHIDSFSIIRPITCEQQQMIQAVQKVVSGGLENSLTILLCVQIQ